MSRTESVTAVAGANFALVKYWGKRNEALNLPAVGSISITVDSLITTTSVAFKENGSGDSLTMNGEPATGSILERVSRFLDMVREMAGMNLSAVVKTENSFPTGAGLASSASGFAALALAASKAAGSTLPLRELSILARRGSGSAARSVFGGFVEMSRGNRDDGTDAVAKQSVPLDHWPLSVLVAVTDRSSKDVGSREGMAHSMTTSPFYADWVSGAENDLSQCRAAILERNFEKLADVSEFNCLKMHAVAMSSRPGLLYWNAATVRLLHEVRRMRSIGIPVFFTVDAGPQVKLICLPETISVVKTRLVGMPEVEKLVECGLGKGVSEKTGGGM
ncbi:MAG: diphosphomevalonate decarboxylase [Acidobacteria bacterium]|nr:diphosphomevalonate decarboxylase [Acidobacteriota bacterium]